MKFYSGFSLIDDERFFSKYLKKSDYTVAGFSYGAIEAFLEVKTRLKHSQRVDTLQLFSPAFFQTQSSKYKKLQMIFYGKNPELYIQNFLENSFSPLKVQKIEQIPTTKEQLHELLYFEWSVAELLELKEQGVIIEIYLGGLDKIVDAQAAKDFFLDVGDVTFIKNGNHFLIQKGEE